MDQKKKNRRLSLEDRKKIQELLHQNMRHKDICLSLDIWGSTLYREFKKCKDSYDAEEAQNNTCRINNLIHWDIIDKRFGLLTVVGYANKYKRSTWWKCKCDCGGHTIMSRKVLTAYCSADRPLSCGCIAKEHRGNGEKVPVEEACLRKFQDLIKFRKINGACWDWIGYRNKGKTPMTSWKNKVMSVRKCMYLLFHGTNYEPNPVFTTCGNLLCFNPEHITLERPNKRHFYE